MALKGAIVAIATPIGDDGSADTGRLVAHARRLFAMGADGLNLLGTTGEATSFDRAERIRVMKAVARAGLPLDRIMVGTGAAALEDAVALTRTASELGYAGALVLPPFYYKGIEDEGLVEFVGRLVDRLGAKVPPLYLYHFPQMTGVLWPAAVVRRLAEAHRGVVVGLKDSSGDLAYSRGLASSLDGFAVFPSSEASLAEACASGFAGCISATLNLSTPLIAAAAAAGFKGEAFDRAVAVRNVVSSYPLIPAIKRLIADWTGDEAFARCAPPWRALDAVRAGQLREAIGASVSQSLSQAFRAAA
jgi:4-hydroxy-tetrahydrodipicolinate synthase